MMRSKTITRTNRLLVLIAATALAASLLGLAAKPAHATKTFSVNSPEDFSQRHL